MRNYRDMKLLIFLSTFILDQVLATCPDRTFVGCVLRLKAQRAPFGRSIINVVLGIDTEAKLRHTCEVYTSTMPCFRDKILECGDDKQYRLLSDVSKMIDFLCSSSSGAAQRALIEHQGCISSVLSKSAVTGCRLGEDKQGKLVLECREQCRARPSDFVCSMRAWISEQNVCTLKDIHESCGAEAAVFYREMQTAVFDPSYPTVCDYQKELELSSTISNTVYAHPILSVTKSDRVQFPALSFNVTSPPIAATFANFEQQPHYPKVVFNNEHRTFRKEHFTGAHPSSEPAQIPRSHKVVSILRNLIPKTLPAKLSSFLSSVLERKSFNQEDHYNTPAASNIQRVTPDGNSLLSKGSKSGNWAPWYFTET